MSLMVLLLGLLGLLVLGKRDGDLNRCGSFVGGFYFGLCLFDLLVLGQGQALNLGGAVGGKDVIQASVGRAIMGCVNGNCVGVDGLGVVLFGFKSLQHLTEMAHFALGLNWVDLSC